MESRLMRIANRTAAPLLLLLLPFILPSYSQANEVLIFAIAVLGCNLLLGYTGLLSFGQGIFFGMGAYAAGYAGTHWGAGLFSMLLIGALVGTAAAVLVGFFSIRQRGVYFVMLTLAFAQLFYFLAYSFRDITGGDNGMTDIPRPPLSLFGVVDISLSQSSSFYVFSAVLFLLAFFALQRIIGSPFGSTLVAIRENEIRAAAVGYNVRGFKLAAFAFSGLLTGLAGALYAPFLGIATLTTIDVTMSQTILIMTLIGGGGSLAGSLVGALFYVVLSSWLSTIWPRWPMLIGFLLVFISMSTPGGLWGGVQQALRSWRVSRRTEHAQ